jgi:indole-3-glycerol phosphate synthase
MSVLDTIVKRRRQRIAESKARTPLGDLKDRISETEQPRDFAGAVRRRTGEGIRLIAELKKASPSKGLIRADFNPAAIARAYAARANALSVLTEEDFFQGHLAFIQTAKDAAPGIPALRKDFIVDEYQIYEARANGADAVLLIDAILDLSQAEEYLHLASELDLAVLYEVHDRHELEHALKLEAPIIGINNRNLKTLEINLGTTLELKKEIPTGHTVVGESGISNHEDAVRLEEAGTDAMLVGTLLMGKPDIAAALDALLGTEATETAR